MRDGSLATRIVEAVATETQTDPLRLEPPLHQILDAEALEQAFRSDTLAGEVEFVAWGCSVTIDAETGAVTVTRLDARQADEQVAD